MINKWEQEDVNRLYSLLNNNNNNNNNNNCLYITASHLLRCLLVLCSSQTLDVWW
jgi:hypothetical protein